MADDQEAWRREREFHLGVSNAQTAFLGKTILSLSAGALGISLTFLEKFVGPGAPVYSGILLAAWVLFITSIIAVLVGLHLSERALTQHIEHLDARISGEGIEQSSRNYWAGVTDISNYTATACFALGLIVFAIFADINYSAEHPPVGVATATKQQPPTAKSARQEKPSVPDKEPQK